MSSKTYASDVLQVSFQIEQLPITAALSKFFFYVLSQSHVVDVTDFEAPKRRSFDYGSSAVWVSKNLMKLEDWSEALTYCRLTIAVYHNTDVLQRTWPIVQSALEEYGLHALWI